MSLRARGAAVLLILVIALAAFADLFHYPPNQVRTAEEIQVLRPPSPVHLLGTDDRGRDVASRLAHGARTSLAVAGGVVLLSLAIGLFLALLASFADPPVLAVCDAIGAVPALLLIVAAEGLFGRASLLGEILLISIPRGADVARILRAELRRALASPFCEAARALGAGRLRVLLRHALPHAWPQLAVAAAITVSTAVLAESALTFVGFGTPAPDASWGELLREAQSSQLAWWLAVPAGTLIAVVALAANTLADELSGRRAPRAGA